MTGVVFDIQTYAVYDGPGIRTCVFFKGCPLRCQWCHNPESHDPKPQTALNPHTQKSEVIGEVITPGEVARRVVKDKPFFERSGGGVTLTGGEATLQKDFLLATLEALKAEGLHTALETCGHFNPTLIRPLAQVTDLFLFDLKHADSAAHKAFTGLGNQKILANFAALLKVVGPKRVTPRVPVIPGFNANPQAAAGLVTVLKEAGYDGPVHLMPYNPLAKTKWEKIGRGAAYRHMGDLSAQTLGGVQAAFTQASFETVICH